MKVISEVPDTSFFPIDNPLIQNAMNTEVPLEGEEDMHITPQETLCENINELRAHSYEVDNDNTHVLDEILNPDNQ